MKLILALFSFLLISCGSDDFKRHQNLETNSANIVLPTKLGENREHIAGSYLVTFKSQVDFNTYRQHSYFGEYQFHFNKTLSKKQPERGVKEIRYLTTTNLTPGSKDDDEVGIWKTFALPNSMKHLFNGGQFRADEPNEAVVARVDFDNDEVAAEVLKKWEKEGKIWFAEPNWISKINGVFDDYAGSYPPLNYSWLRTVQVVEGFKYFAQQIQDGFIDENSVLDNPPVIAVMDSGLDYEHEAFTNRLWVNENPGASDCPNDIHGCDLTVGEKGLLGNGNSIHPFTTAGPNKVCPKALEGKCLHGTHVAGIIAGRDDKDVGGICPVCKIMVLKVLDASFDKSGSVSDDSIIAGLKYVTRFAKDNRNLVRIVNASISKFQKSRNVALLVNQLKNNLDGTLVIGAAGNEGTSLRAYPAALNDAIAVSALETDGKKAGYSNSGIWVDIAAPGGEPSNLIFSANPGKGIIGSKGTSMAAPIVAGVAGMVVAMEPRISISDLRARVVETADRSIYNPEVAGGYNRNYYYKYIEVDDVRVPLLGSGQVDLLAALSNDRQGINIRPFLNSRVQSSCGVISENVSNRSGYTFVLVLLFALPIFLGGIARKRVRYTGPPH